MKKKRKKVDEKSLTAEFPTKKGFRSRFPQHTPELILFTCFLNLSFDLANRFHVVALLDAMLAFSDESVLVYLIT
jgi:hypothetical protein